MFGIALSAIFGKANGAIERGMIVVQLICRDRSEASLVAVVACGCRCSPQSAGVVPILDIQSIFSV